jgi:hypothetical protein
MATPYGATKEDPLGWAAIAAGRTAGDPLGWAKIAAGLAPAAPGVRQPYPTTFDETAYQRDTSQLGNQRQLDLTANDYARNLAVQRRALKLETLNKGQENQRMGFNTPWLKRGFFNSGLKQQGLNNLFTQQANEQSTNTLNNTSEEFDFNQKGAAVESNYQAALRQLAEKRQQALYQQYSGLGAVQPFMPAG